MDSHFLPQRPVKAFAAQAGYLYGWVDTSVPGHRAITIGATTYTIPSGYYRGDEIATELTALGLSTTFDAIFTVNVPGSDTLTSTDRLAVLMGLLTRAGQQLASATKHESTVCPPVAIPLHGAIWTQVTVDVDDVHAMSRQRRVSGYCWGAVRVWDVELLMPTSSLEAFQFGWCGKGKVTIVCGTDAPMSSSETGGSIEGTVLSVSRPEWLSEGETGCIVRMRIAEATP
jgi:hypothetical protein